MVSATIYLKAKEEAAVLKKAYEGMSGALQSLICDGPDAQQRLPGMTGEDIPEDSWREVPIEDAIKLTAKQLIALHEFGVATMGELRDARTDVTFSAIEGIGATAAVKIEDQFLTWMLSNCPETLVNETLFGNSDAGRPERT